MISRRGLLLAGGSAVWLAGCERVARLGASAPAPEVFAAPSGTSLDLAQHVLARCSFGIRPGDRAALLALGPTQAEAARAWLEQQLEPQKLGDEACERALARCDSLGAPIGELYEYKPQVLLRELTAAALLRATLSRRQLYEVLVEFWTDHFNISVEKGACWLLKTVDDREVIRPHALGRFGDLLWACLLYTSDAADE